MTPRRPLHVTERARLLLNETDDSTASIATELGVTARTVRRWRLSFDLFGEAYAPSFTTKGRPRALTVAQERWLLDYLDDQPTVYLDELSLALHDAFDIEVSPRAVWDYLERNQWSRKVTHRRAREASQELRAAWRNKTDYWSMDRLVFCDESALNEKTG